MFQSIGGGNRTKEQRNYILNNCIKKVTLPLKQNIGQLVGKGKLLFFFLFILLQRNTILGKVTVHYGEIREIDCCELRSPPLWQSAKPCSYKNSPEIMAYQWRSKIVNDSIMRASGTKLAWTALSYVQFFHVLGTRQTCPLRNNSVSNGIKLTKKYFVVGCPKHRFKMKLIEFFFF